MPRWRELPAELHPQVVQLIVRLRRLKDRSGLTTRQLAARTGYSAKSWQRYLNGRSLPPRETVEALARITDDDPDRLLVLHEIAAERWAEGKNGDGDADTDRPAATPGPPRTPPEEPPYGRHLRGVLAAGAVAVVLSLSVVVLLAVRLAETRAELADVRAEQARVAPAVVSETLVPVTYTCRMEQRDGQWYAGLSRTSETVLAYTHVGPQVAEAQCLLRRTGIPPGEVDGVFGPKTQRAVRRMQERDGLVVDGVIGPHTWKALREAAEG
ncbi:MULTISPECIES: peptidoglycan-binding protein [unclassified Streptomyces]|uniref:peptidoglycan-binding protein n=1 Tax=unclassified Streptomyces TaxID=2593676 RepID=UPI000F6F02B1|nr:MULTISPECIES: peptidoglycan-binding protein [unclassified Streptomyces]AZM60793.1 peptidoglycan-binding protein [Streptomyces sp. WAC 01438]RSM96984.1 peptidoglycan-binding protein [Streptomyces sp. WAC 01420]